MQLHNYLFFRADCERALSFYADCGLGQIVELQHHSRPPGSYAMPCRVLHARFEGPGVAFFASDNDDAEPMRGSAHILMIEEAEKAASTFATLSAGGKVTTPLGPTPWSRLYGKFTDRFGVQWMINCTS